MKNSVLMPAAHFDDVLNRFKPSDDPVILVLVQHLEGHDERRRDILKRGQTAGNNGYFFVRYGIGHICKQIFTVMGQNGEFHLESA